jgi:hypothetical protein
MGAVEFDGFDLCRQVAFEPPSVTGAPGRWPRGLTDFWSFDAASFSVLERRSDLRPNRRFCKSRILPSAFSNSLRKAASRSAACAIARR